MVNGRLPLESVVPSPISLNSFKTAVIISNLKHELCWRLNCESFHANYFSIIRVIEDDLICKSRVRFLPALALPSPISFNPTETAVIISNLKHELCWRLDCNSFHEKSSSIIQVLKVNFIGKRWERLPPGPASSNHRLDHCRVSFHLKYWFL